MVPLCKNVVQVPQGFFEVKLVARKCPRGISHLYIPHLDANTLRPLTQVPPVFDPVRAARCAQMASEEPVATLATARAKAPESILSAFQGHA